MRQIKFRGYSEKYKSWHYGCLDFTADGKCFIKSINENGTASRTRVDEDSVGQYIDQEDAFGIEIYEGDFLQDDEGNVYEVVWSDSRSMFEVESDGGTSDFDHCCGQDFEIIGNRYEE